MWLYVPCLHEVSVTRWQVVHVVEKPAVTWFGFREPWNDDWWHE